MEQVDVEQVEAVTLGELATAGDQRLWNRQELSDALESLDTADRGVESRLGLYAITDEQLRDADLKDVKRYRADINSAIKSRDEARKALERVVMGPVRQLLGEGTRNLDRLKRLERRYKAEVDGRADRERAEKLEEIERAYIEYAPTLVPLVPFERIANPKWGNKSKPLDECLDEMREIVSQITTGWDTLRSMGADAETEAEFFRTLSLSEAIKSRKSREEEKQRISAVKNEVDAQKRIQKPEAVSWVLQFEATVAEAREAAGRIGEMGLHGTLRRE